MGCTTIVRLEVPTGRSFAGSRRSNDGDLRVKEFSSASIQQRAMPQVKCATRSRRSRLMDGKLFDGNDAALKARQGILPDPGYSRQIGLSDSWHGNHRLRDLPGRARLFAVAGLLIRRCPVLPGSLLGAHRTGWSLLRDLGRLCVSETAPAHRRTDEKCEHHC